MLSGGGAFKELSAVLAGNRVTLPAQHDRSHIFEILI